MKAVIILLGLMLLGLAMAAVMETRAVNSKDIAKIRCSLNKEDETFFFFNGSVIAYFTGANKTNQYLFKTIGINVGRCWERSDGTYSLASRELLYYLDPATDKIIDKWVNPWNPSLGELTVAHVDNDPVLQNFSSDTSAILQVYDDKAFLNLDIPLAYPNALFFNSTFALYSPQRVYQAGEFFKFIFPVANLDNKKDTVDYSLVSWTREGPFLPWMAMGDTQGHLIYSSSGAKIPSWEYLPAGVKADLENRIPHYKHAPLCVPNTRSVTSWSFFAAHFAEWQAGAQFPLAEAAKYGCIAGTEVSGNIQKGSASSVAPSIALFSVAALIILALF